MKVIYDILENTNLIKDSYIAIGAFDGIHIGHKKLINSAVDSARRHNGKSVVFTFYTHPKEAVNREAAPKMINSLEEKIYLLEKLGVDYLVLQPFTEEFSQLSPNEFVRKILVETLAAKEVFVGFNFGFGRGRSATAKDLEEICRQYFIKVRVISPVKVSDKIVSSTAIRSAVIKGDVGQANALLGEPLLIAGKVVHGRKLGRQMGIPTANLERGEKSFLPYGIYGGSISIQGENEREYNAVINIGRNPTLKPGESSIEVHILDFNEDIYDKKIYVRIIKYLREEKKFNSMEELKLQINRDIDIWRKFIENIHNLIDCPLENIKEKNGDNF